MLINVYENIQKLENDGQMWLTPVKHGKIC